MYIVIGNLTQQQIKDRLNVVNMSIDYELMVMFEGMQEGNYFQIQASKESLRWLCKEKQMLKDVL